MGSLMAGWDSPVKDPKTVMLQRNKSLTKEEIAAYWKSKGGGPPNENQENMHKQEPVQKHRRSNSLPLTDRRESSVNGKEEGCSKADADKLPKTNCWWTRSNWAFLNEPPVIDTTEGNRRYTPQFHVARFGGSQIST